MRRQAGVNLETKVSALPGVREWSEQAPVEHTVFKILRHLNGICGTSLNTQIAHGAQFQMINKSVQRFFLFSFGGDIKLCNDFYGSVGAGQFTGRTAGTGMFIVFIMFHYYLTTKAFG